MGDRIAVFNQGRIEQIGAPLELYERPANEFVAAFIGAPRINFIDRPVAGAATDPHLSLWARLTAAAGPVAQRVGLRAEHVTIMAGAEPGIAAEVELAEHLGDSSILYLRIAGLSELLSAKVGAGHGGIHAGQRVAIDVDAAAVLRFGGGGGLLG